MGYRRLKEKVKEQKRKETKLYGNMISKLSKLEDSETEVSSLLWHPAILCLRYYLIHRI
jgi:hypothetical protein